MRHGIVARHVGVGWRGVNENPERESLGLPRPTDEGDEPPADRPPAGPAATPHDHDRGGPDGIDEGAGHGAPAFGIMLHLLAATALAFASLVWGALVLLGAVERTWLRGSFSLAGLLLAVAWLFWLFRVTVDRDVWEDELPPPGGPPAPGDDQPRE